MIVTLRPGCRIHAVAVNEWHVAEMSRPWRLRRDDLEYEARTVARATTFEVAFELALAEGCVEPGKPLDLSGFKSIIADAARRFDAPAVIRLADGYTALCVNANEWLVRRDCGRGGKHAVQIAASIATALIAAVFHAALRERRMLTAPEAGAYLSDLAHRILDGAVVGD